MNLRPYIEKFARRLGEVESALSDPKLFDNPAKSQEISREYARLKDLTETGGRYLKAIHDLEQHEAFLKSEPAESELAQARRRYTAGISNSIEVTDAQTRLTRARDNQIAALYAYNLARVDLAQATGTIRQFVQ